MLQSRIRLAMRLSLAPAVLIMGLGLAPLQAYALPTLSLPTGWSAQASHTDATINGISVVLGTDGKYHGAFAAGDVLRYTLDGTSLTGAYSAANHALPTIPFYIPATPPIDLSLTRVQMITQDQGWAVGERPSALLFGNVNFPYSFGNAVILHTADGGRNWAIQGMLPTEGTTKDLEGLYFMDSNEGWVVGDRGTIVHTTDAGQNWTDPQALNMSCLPGTHPLASPRTVIPNCKGIVGISVHLNNLGQLEGWAVGDQGLILHTLDGGATGWNVVHDGGIDYEGLFCADATSCWAVGGEPAQITSIKNGQVHTVTPDNGVGTELYSVAFAQKADGTWHGFAVGEITQAARLLTARTADPKIASTEELAVMYESVDGGATWGTQMTPGAGTLNYHGLKDISMPNACNAWTSGRTGGAAGETSGVVLRFNDANGCTNPTVQPPVTQQTQAETISLPKAGDGSAPTMTTPATQPSAVVWLAMVAAAAGLVFMTSALRPLLRRRRSR
jgi:hypothetical protein